MPVQYWPPKRVGELSDPDAVPVSESERLALEVARLQTWLKALQDRVEALERPSAG